MTDPDPLSGPLEGRVALVTGSAGGIGLAAARALAGAGARVMLHGRERQGRLAESRTALDREFPGRIDAEPADLAQADAAERLAAAAARRLGPVDILVNNAAIRHFAAVGEMAPADWDRAIAVNLSAPFHLTRLTLPGMRERGFGRIVNISSVAGFRAQPNRSDYAATKAGLQGLTRAVAAETVADPDITCNAVCPGAVRTPVTMARIAALAAARRLDPETATAAFLQGRQASGRLVPPEHVGALIAFLCGPAAREINGAEIPVDDAWAAML